MMSSRSPNMNILFQLSILEIIYLMIKHITSTFVNQDPRVKLLKAQQEDFDSLMNKSQETFLKNIIRKHIISFMPSHPNRSLGKYQWIFNSIPTNHITSHSGTLNSQLKSSMTVGIIQLTSGHQITLMFSIACLTNVTCML